MWILVVYSLLNNYYESVSMIGDFTSKGSCVEMGQMVKAHAKFPNKITTVCVYSED